MKMRSDRTSPRAREAAWSAWWSGSSGFGSPVARYRVLRPAALLTLIAFTSLVTLPASAAAPPLRAKSEAAHHADVPPSPEERYSELLGRIEQQVRQAKARRGGGISAGGEIAQVRSYKNDLDALESTVETSFVGAGSDMRASDASIGIQAQQNEALASFKARQADFNALMRALLAADDTRNESARDAAVDALSTFFARYPQAKRHTPLDPRRLPFAPAPADVRAPATDAGGLPLALGSERILLAGPVPEGTTLQPAAAAPPQSADLAPTDDVQITPQIRDLAASLGNHPVRIYNWVRNNVEYLPTYGSIQGSSVTLTAKRGNAFDIASLLIALYRAANIPTRYVYGSIEVPIEQAKNWVGNVSSAGAALSLLGQGGIPNTGLVSGGTFVAVRMEHVWVEAYVDYVPSRGAINAKPNTWTPVDASFKQYQATAPVDVRPALQVDVPAVKASLTANASIDVARGSMTGFDESVLTTLFDSVRDSLGATYGGQPALSQIVGSRTIVPSNGSVLPGSLPYKTVAKSPAVSALPASLRHQVALRMYASDFDRALDSPSVVYTLSLPALAGRRLGITYQPASTADATALASYQASPSYTTLPLYAVRVKPAIQIDGVTQSEGPAATMGTEQVWEAVLSGPNMSGHQHPYTVAAGDELVFGIDGAGVTQDMIHARFQAGPSDTAAENLHTIALYYWAQHDALNQVAAAAKGVVVQRLPSIGLFSAPLQVSYMFGIPRLGTYGSRQMDISYSLLAAVRKDGSASTVDFFQTTGAIASQLEGRTFDALLSRESGTGVSAVQLLREANEQRIPIYEIDANNYAQTLPRLALDVDIVNDIANAVQAGKRVIVPERAPMHGNWQGVGYIVADPDTGAAAYLINGGLNGGADDPCDPDRKKEPVRVPILEMLLIALILIAIFAIILLAPEIAVAAGVAMAWGARLLPLLGLAATPAVAAPLPPGPGDGMSSPGDCSPGQHLALQAAVNQYCHGTASCRAYPQRGASCSALSQLRDTWLNCALARSTINNTCFKGGNVGHRQAEIDAYNAVATCECRLASNGCGL